MKTRHFSDACVCIVLVRVLIKAVAACTARRRTAVGGDFSHFLEVQSVSFFVTTYLPIIFQEISPSRFEFFKTDGKKMRRSTCISYVFLKSRTVSVGNLWTGMKLHNVLVRFWALFNVPVEFF